MTAKTAQRLRQKIWGSLPRYSHAPEPCTAEVPCELCGRSIDKLLQLFKEAMVEIIGKDEDDRYKRYGRTVTFNATVTSQNVLRAKQRQELKKVIATATTRSDIDVLDQPITLRDLEEYASAYRAMQIAKPGEPQCVTQPSVLESFVVWMKGSLHERD